MIQLSDEQLNQLGKEALVVIVSALQDQLLALQSQLDQDVYKRQAAAADAGPFPSRAGGT